MTRTFDPVQIGSIEIFLKAAETASFAAAANALGVTPPAVSRSIARLESRLGVQLFARTTRQIRLTDDGRLYFEECQQALQQIADVEDALAGRRGAPSGTLRISVPTTYGHYRVIPALPSLLARFPAINIEVNVSNRNVDFIEEGYDLAVRLGTPSDSRLVARKLEDANLGVFASPAYLKARSAPRHVADLALHNLIQFELPSSGRPLPWLFRVGGKDEDLSFKSNIRFSDDVLACVSHARADGGLVQMYDFVVAEDIRQGRLVEVLKPLRGRSRPFSILYQQNRHLSPKVRAFVDHLLAVL
jgi:DNA-binding transcriptional LysR family regulator